MYKQRQKYNTKLHFIFTQEHVGNALLNYILPSTVTAYKLTFHNLQFQKGMMDVLENFIGQLSRLLVRNGIANLFDLLQLTKTYIRSSHLQSLPVNLFQHIQDKISVEIFLSLLHASFIHYNLHLRKGEKPYLKREIQLLFFLRKVSIVLHHC